MKSGLDRSVSRWIKKLNLKKHPEGGYFCETYRSRISLDHPDYQGARSASSAIYYMLAGRQISRFHRLKSDEIWHHYAGGALLLYTIKGDKMSKCILGTGIRQLPQIVVEKNTWIAASVMSGAYALVGCTVSPGFDFRDWEIGARDHLVSLCPRDKGIIERYTTV